MFANEADAPKQAQAQAPASLDREGKQAQALAGFDLAISLLEARVGRRLNGPWRRQAEAAFAECEQGFCLVLRDLLARRGVRSHFAVFMKMLSDGDHLEAAPPSAPPDGVSRNITPEGEIVEVRIGELLDLDAFRALPEPCSVCKLGGGHHLEDCSTIEPSDPRPDASADLQGRGNGAQAE